MLSRRQRKLIATTIGIVTLTITLVFYVVRYQNKYIMVGESIVQLSLQTKLERILLHHPVFKSYNQTFSKSRDSDQPTLDKSHQPGQPIFDKGHVPDQSTFESKFDFFLENHPVFREYRLPRVQKSHKRRVNVLVIVSTAPKRRDRRDSIRKTWWKDCVTKNQVGVG